MTTNTSPPSGLSPAAYELVQLAYRVIKFTVGLLAEWLETHKPPK